MLALGQAPFGVWPVALAGAVLALLRGLGAPGPRPGFARGFSVGFGFALLAMSWIVEPFLVDIARHGWMAPFALAAMAAGFGLFWGAGFAVAGWLAPGSGAARALALAVCWTGAELVRAYLFTGLPWALVSYQWIGTPVYQLAAYAGPHGVTFLTLVLAGAAALAATRRRLGAAALVAAGLALVWGAGLVLTPLTGLDKDTARPFLRLIQPNAPQHLKWKPEWRDIFFERQLALTAEPGAPDIVIWPEVAVTFRLESADAPYERISAAAGGRPVILGGQRVEAGRVYNSVIVLGADAAPQALYDKHHLVPFGEYMPGGALAGALGLRGLAQQLAYGFATGPGPVLLSAGQDLSFLPMICYEAIFPHELRAASRRPDFLLHLTNDAWFGARSGPYQHLDQARARAIEFDLPVIRVANTGISAVINRAGRIVQALPLGEPGRIDALLPQSGPPSVYWRFGDSPVVLALFLIAAAQMLVRRRNTD